MKVFSSYPCRKSGKFQSVQGWTIAFITLFGVPCIQHSLHTGVEHCLFEHGLPEPPADKRKVLHTFFCITPLGAKEQIRPKMNITGFSPKLSKPLWALVISLATLGIGEYYKLCALYSVGLILSSIVGFLTILVLIAYTINSFKAKKETK